MSKICPVSFMFVLGHIIEKYFLILTAFTLHTQAIVPNWETNSNASQFVNLENLVGSIHRYAPEYVHVFVRDMGLSKGQRMLLRRYQNVKIVSSTDTIPERTQLIAVEKELVIIDGKYTVRRSNGKLLYADSIRKRFHLAIVIPFIRSQLSKLILQLNFSSIYIPCEHSFDSVDLIFYHNEGRHSSLEMAIRKIKYVNKCYRNVRYLAINLTADENRYPLGSFIMWQKLLVDDEKNNLSLRTYGYTHFFLMEPDTRPIRPFWLDAIIDQITNDGFKKLYCSTNWWVSGSVYRGSEPIGHHFLHINGNALYHLSASFIAYVQLFSGVCLTGNHSNTGYDLLMFSFLLDNQDLAKRYLHKFRFSDFIHNCWHTGCKGSDQLNNTQFILNNPNTYLIHGSFLKNSTTKQQSSNVYVIILFSAAATIFVWQYRRLLRLLKLKRIIMLFFS
jgi:hypothetical protein